MCDVFSDNMYSHRQLTLPQLVAVVVVVADVPNSVDTRAHSDSFDPNLEY